MHSYHIICVGLDRVIPNDQTWLQVALEEFFLELHVQRRESERVGEVPCQVKG